jgi:hypothetical protein
VIGDHSHGNEVGPSLLITLPDQSSQPIRGLTGQLFHTLDH